MISLALRAIGIIAYSSLRAPRDGYYSAIVSLRASRDGYLIDIHKYAICS